MCSSSSSYAGVGVGGCGLIVEGIALGSGGQFTPRLTMKRVYDTKCFRPERYRHEVANHYRDYKLQQHLQQHQHPFGQRHRGHRRRRRHRQFLAGGGVEATSRVSASLASQYAQFRDVWPTHQHYFPRSNDTTTSSSDIRGRRSPNETYNDAVRRIRSAHSCEQLRQLVQRQLERHRLPWRRRSSNDEALATEALGGSQSSDHRFDYKLNIHKRQAESPQGQGEEEQVQRQRVDLYAYLQLASGYYERGLQADLKYLQSIGQQRQQRRHHRNAIRPEDSESPVQRLTGRLVTLLKSLRRKAADQDEPRRASHPEIRVNIRSVKQEPEPEQETDEEEAQEEEEEQQQEGSMCDYYAPGFSTTEARASIATADQRRLYEIVDNLSHLSIAGESGVGGGGAQLTLPQITLTDYSNAQQVALYGNSIVTLQMLPNEASRGDLRAT